MKRILTSILALLVYFVGARAAYSQKTVSTIGGVKSNLVAIHPSISFSCTASVATIAAGASYVNTCTVTQGTGPFRFSTSGLPKGLAMTTSTKSATISGTLGAGHYEYVLNVSGAGYSNSWMLMGIDVLQPSAFGKTTIRCLQKGGPTIKDPPLCQTCVTTSSGRICDRDNNFNVTKQVPTVPSAARVSSVYLDYAPATANISAYALTLTHTDTKKVTKEIAHQIRGQAPSFATQTVPVVDFNGQAAGGQWTFDFTPSMTIPLPTILWMLDFQYNVAWFVRPAAVMSSAPAVLAEDKIASGADQCAGIDLSRLQGLEATLLPGATVITAAPLADVGASDLLIQNQYTGAIEVWRMSGAEVAAKAQLSKTLDRGWKVVGAVDLTNDGIAEILLQNEYTRAIDVWQISGTDVSAEAHLAESPAPGWRVAGAAHLADANAVSLVLQHEDSGVIAIWTLSGLEVTAKAELSDVPPHGWSVTTVADVTGDGLPDVVLQKDDGSGAAQVWQIRELQAVGQSEVVGVPLGSRVAGTMDSSDGGRSVLLVNPGTGRIQLSPTGGHQH